MQFNRIIAFLLTAFLTIPVKAEESTRTRFNPQTASENDNHFKRNKKAYIVGASILAALGLGLASYYILNRGNKEPNPNNDPKALDALDKAQKSNGDLTGGMNDSSHITKTTAKTENLYLNLILIRL